MDPNMSQTGLTRPITTEGAFAAEIPLHSQDLSLAALESLEGSVLLQTVRLTESREAYFASHSSHSSHSSHGTAAW